MELPVARVWVFDFDGVLLESVHVKDEAFRDLFPAITDEERRAVLDFHQATPGVHRRVKVERILTEVLGCSADGGTVDAALHRFRESVWDRLMRCPEVPGVRAFLEEHPHATRYVVSASPNQELRELAAERDFSRYFQDVLGSPPGKIELLRSIVEREQVRPEEVLMFGDKQADLRAALAAGVRFVGREPYEGHGEFPQEVPKICSFAEIVGSERH